jgi:uncharacterized protein (UPF0264 family)
MILQPSLRGVSRLPDGLLVSVRSVEEAVEAIEGGAAIIDVKEPGRGPLGRADAAIAAAIADTVGTRAACTLACGELATGQRGIAAHVQRVAELVSGDGPGIGAVKVGPAGLDVAAWREAFATLAGALPTGIELVAVAYADFQVASAPSPTALIAAAVEAGAATLLIDTFDKEGPGLYGVAGPVPVRGWVKTAREAGLTVALAGRLTAAETAVAAVSGARIVGVRSAACGGIRTGRVDRRNVGKVVGTLKSARGYPGSSSLGVGP